MSQYEGIVEDLLSYEYMLERYNPRNDWSEIDEPDALDDDDKTPEFKKEKEKNDVLFDVEEESHDFSIGKDKSMSHSKDNSVANDRWKQLQNSVNKRGVQK